MNFVVYVTTLVHNGKNTDAVTNSTELWRTVTLATCALGYKLSGGATSPLLSV